MQITDEMLSAATKAIVVQMQCYDFGHLTDDGDFVTTEVKINLLEARAKEAARAALSAVLSGVAEPVAFDPDLLKEVIGDICTFRDMEPEEDESWQSWYFAAFDMLIGRVRETFERNTRQALATPPASDLREENNWQPIETAPRNGTEIIVGGCKTGSSVRVSHWGAGRFNRKTKGYDRDWTDGVDYGFGPTHWQPLPAPPAINPEGK